MKRTVLRAKSRATSKPAAKRTAKPHEKTIPSDVAANGNGVVALKGPEEELTLTQTAYRSLEELIVTLQLPPGMVLSEHALVTRLGIGRTPIREALQRLGRDGLVQILPRRGILVSEINLKTQLRLLEVRREMERLIARLAAERARPAERQQLAQIGTGMLQAARQNDHLTFLRLDQEFNALVADAARNEFAIRSMSLMHGLSRRFWYQHYQQVADLPLTAKLHAHVAIAIAEGRVEDAAAASDKLIDYIESFARSTLNA